MVKLRRGLLLRPLVGPTRATARRASVLSTELSENRIRGSNAYSQCQPVAVENREAIRTTSMMDDCNAKALTPMRKRSIAVLSPRLFRKLKSRRWLWKRLATGFELSRGGPATRFEHSDPGASGTQQLDDLVVPAFCSPCQRRCPRFGI